MRSKTLVLYISGYKPNSGVLTVIKIAAAKLKCNFYELSYRLSNNIFNKDKIIKKIILKTKKTLKENKFNKVILVGYSLGAAIAVEISTTCLFDKLILISIFDDRKDLLKKRGIYIEEYENISPIKKINQINIPVTFIHGNNDSSIEIKRAKKVFKKANQKSSFLKINTDHYFKSEKQKKELYTQLLCQLQ